MRDRAARAGRLLEAARRRADVRLRAADVHHRRRHPAADPADGHHAALRLLRRIERRRELPALSRAAARLESREPGDAAVNKQVSQLGVAALVLHRGAHRRRRRTGRRGRTRASRTGRTTTSGSSRSSRSSAARSTRPTVAPCWRRTSSARSAGQDALLPPLPERLPLLGRRRLLDADRATAPASSARTTTT